MRLLVGKGLWLQRLAACEQGDLAAIVARATAAGLAHVIVKIADGADPVNVAAPDDPARALTERLTHAGIDVWGWQSLYGDRPAFKGGFVDAYHQREAETAAARVQALRAAGLRGLVLEARGEYERIPERARKAAEFMRQLRAGWPDLPLALSSWRAPAAHPRFPWAEFRQSCDLDLPQVFWTGQHGVAARSLEAAHRQFSGLDPARPLAAAGPAFFEANWRPAPNDLADFVETAARLGLTAANLWLWDQLGLRGAEPENPARLDFRPHWEAFAAATWPSRPVSGGATPPLGERAIELESPAPPAPAEAPLTAAADFAPEPQPTVALTPEAALTEASASGLEPEPLPETDWAAASPPAEAPLAEELPEALAAALAEALAEAPMAEADLPSALIDTAALSAALDEAEPPTPEVWAELLDADTELSPHLVETAAEEPDLGTTEALEPALADALAAYLDAADEAPPPTEAVQPEWVAAASPDAHAVPELADFEAPPWLRPPLEATAEPAGAASPATADDEVGRLWAAAVAAPDSDGGDALPEWLQELNPVADDAEAEALAAWPEAEPADDELPDWLQAAERPLPEAPAPARRIFLTPDPAGEAPPADVVAFFKALRSGQLEAALARYAPGFAHVTAERVAHDPADVRAFYAALLTEGRAAGLAVQASSGTPPLVRVRWILPVGGDVWRRYEDEFHLNRAGKIVYHRTIAVR